MGSLAGTSLASPSRRVVVVGASLAGLSAVEELRRRGFDGELVLVGAEDRFPYDRPPLSKEVLGGRIEPGECALRPAGWAAEMDVELRLGVAATALDPGERTVALADGGSLRFDGLVIATGAVPRRLAGAPPGGVHVLRTAEDAIGLRGALAGGARLAVVGGGFIGAEVAATARGSGADVTLIEAAPAPLSRVLGPEMGRVFSRLHGDHGVRVRCGVPVAAFEGGERVTGVRLADGSLVEADVVLLGLGVLPCTGWLESSGLRLEDGVVCDAQCLTSAPGIVAAGDVARWRHPALGPVRIEHWENAVTQGHAAAAALLEPGTCEPYAPVPYVWSDQYDRKIQIVGRPAPGDDVVVVEGVPGDLEFTALYGRGGRLTAGVAVNRRASIRRLRRQLAAGASLEAAVAGFANVESAA